MRYAMPNRTWVRGFKMQTIAGFLRLLPGVRPGLAGKLIKEWEIIGPDIDDVYHVLNFLKEGDTHYYLLGSRAAQRILNAYLAGLLPMKSGAIPRQAMDARYYIASEHLLPPYYDSRRSLVRDAHGKVRMQVPTHSDLVAAQN